MFGTRLNYYYLIFCLFLLTYLKSTSASDSVNELLSKVFVDCPLDVELEKCARYELSNFLGLNPNSEPKEFVRRLGKLLATNDIRLTLPEFMDNAELVFRPGRGIDFDVEFPKTENDILPREMSHGKTPRREMMKNKMLFPLLMLIKLKLKALTPIMLALIGLKSLKALVLSKIAILLVVGFLVAQLCQKLGMAKMSMMPAAPEAMTAPPSMYGPPTTSGYEPQGWEPSSNGGPYSRVYDAHPIAYASYSSSQNSGKFKS